MTVYGAGRLRLPLVPKSVTGYRCRECLTISDDFEMLMLYKCPFCEELYEYADDAMECHSEESNG